MLSATEISQMPITSRLDQNCIPVTESGCWLWTASLKGGYGRISIRGVGMLAHRVSWEQRNGPIPKGMLVCHKCDTRSCINPSHLFVGSHEDNNRDCVAKRRNHFQSKSHCPHGHAYSAENTQISKRTGARACRACDRARSLNRYYLNRMAEGHVTEERR